MILSERMLVEAIGSGCSKTRWVSFLISLLLQWNPLKGSKFYLITLILFFIPLSLEGECWNIRASRYLPITIFVEYSIFSTLQCLLRAHYKHDYSLDAKLWSLTRNLQQSCLLFLRLLVRVSCFNLNQTVLLATLSVTLLISFVPEKSPCVSIDSRISS